MRVRINWICAPKKKFSESEAENIFIDREVEFVPAIGSHIQVHRDGELGEVDGVYIDLYEHTDGVPQVFIYLKESDNPVDLRPWLEMKKQGWKLDCPDEVEA